MGRQLSIIVLACLGLCPGPVSATKLVVERGSDLQKVIDFANSGDTLLLGAKTFEAKRNKFTEPLCGNCLETRTPVEASYGFIIKDKELIIQGENRRQTRLETNAGYGVYFENAGNSVIKNLTITDGMRDPDGNATDAGIVVRTTRLTVEAVDVVDNDHKLDTVIVGIGGIFGREGSELYIHNCNIINNGWDGIALYRGASAVITDCFIKNGRGAGIGVTWDATCTAFRNEVTGYWKGIGSFGTSIVIARNNLVHENLGWGIIATGESCLDATNNVIYHNGNCGIAPWSTESRGLFLNNIIVGNGWREQWVCPCVGVWNYGDWAKWKFENNIVWNNKDGNYRDIWDQTDILGNLSVDPKFVNVREAMKMDEDSNLVRDTMIVNRYEDFQLQPDSPAWNRGDSLSFNLDGSRSHIGLFGGPQARKLKE